MKADAVRKLQESFAGNADVAALIAFVNGSDRGLLQMGAGTDD